jgi:sulfite oxidase
MASVTTMNVKSLIASPADGGFCYGPAVIQGVAWTGGDAVVTKVEVKLSWPRGGTDWVDAQFDEPARPYAWRTWSCGFGTGPGPLSVRVRATDSTGARQPEVPPWNKSGYLWNGYDHVDFQGR